MASKKTQYESASDFSNPAKSIEKINVAEEMENSFLEYSYSVIYSRALPDARDGLKPVHRRILYTMIENGYTPDKAHVKSARIVGTCFTKGTLIHTPEGLKTIESFQIGDKVLTPEGTTTTVTECFTIPDSETVTITYANGVQNTATPDQLVMTVGPNFEKTWVEADSLTGRIVISNKQYSDTVKQNAAEQYGEEIAKNLSITDNLIMITEKLSQPSEYTASILTRMNLTFKKTTINDLNIIFIHPAEAKQLSQLLNQHLTETEHKQLQKLYEQYGTQTLKNQTIPATPLIQLLTENNINPYEAEFVQQYGDAFIHSKDENMLLLHIDNANTNGLTKLITTINPTVAENIQQLQGYRYNPVVNIETHNTLTTTYDIKVEDINHAFIADGIYYSNCMGVYHPHGDCLAGDTLIVDVEGNEHYLADLANTGKTIIVDAVDKEGKIVTAKAHSFRVGQTTTTVYEIMFDNGLTVKATNNHPFLSISGEWVKTENIKEGAAFRSATYNPSIKHIELTTAVVTKIVKHDVPPTDMFDFTVDKHENLFIAHKTNGVYHMIAAHNSAIYEAMVRMAQPFSMRVPFVDGHGNFGGTPDDSPASSRYCLTGDTRVLQADGKYVRIDSIVDLPADSEKPLTLDVVDWQGNHVPAVKGFNSGYHPVIKIKLANGLTLKGSENHPVLCFTETGTTTWKTLQEITLDDQPLTFLGKIVPEVEPPHAVLKPDMNITVGKQQGVDTVIIPENVYHETKTNKVVYIQNLLQSLDKTKVDDIHYSHVFEASLTQLQELLLTLHVYSETGETDNKHFITIYDEYNTLGLPVKNSHVGYKYVQGNRYVASPVVEKTESGVEQVYSIKVDTKDHSFLAGGFINHNTEARLSKQGLAFIGEIKEEAVDFVPNFDSSTVQPAVLPATFPNLLINGTSGIAVGMATNMPPHNPVEVVEAAKMIVEKPEATLDEIMEHIKGPDFPTGGQIIGKDQLLEAYTTGKGLIKIRARMDVEATGGGKHRITVYEHPYQIGFEKIISSIKDEVNKKRITGVSRVVDLTDRRLGTHLVIDVKSGTNPETVKAALYRYTPLESSFGIQNLALVNGQPKYVSLSEMLNIFVTHRKNVVTRRTQYRLNKKQSRLHLVKGLLLIIADIDKAIAIIRASENVDEAKTSLKTEFKIDEIQSEYVLTLQLKRLTKYDSLELNTEHDQLVKEIAELTKILNSEQTLNQLVISEMDDVLKTIADERKTEISDMVIDSQSDKTTSEGISVEDLPEETIYLTTKGMIENEWVKNTIVSQVTFKGSFLGITKDGQAHRMRKGDQYPGLIAITPDFGYKGNIIIGTKEGIVKVVTPDYPTRQDDFSIINLAPKDEIVTAVWVEDYKKTTATFITTDANLLAFPLEKVNPQGRNAGGVTGIKLTEGQHVLAFSATTTDAYITTWTGMTVKTTPLNLYPVKGRGGKGMRCHKFLKGETELKYAKIAYNPTGFAGSKKITLPEVSEKRDGSGTKIPNLTVVHDIKNET